MTAELKNKWMDSMLIYICNNVSLHYTWFILHEEYLQMHGDIDFIL